jgi:glycine cleavage system H lipoate-binding protein
MVALLVILTLIVAVSIELIIAKRRKVAEEPTVAAIPVFNKSSLYAPDGYYFSQFHTWVRPEEKEVKVGIDNFALKALGKIIIRNIAPEGKLVKKGDTIIEADVHGQKVLFRSPVNGVIKSVNANVLNNTLSDVYGNDWGLTIEKDATLTETFHKMLFGNNAYHWMKSELRRFKDFLSENSFAPEAVGVTMYDGGNITEGVLSSLGKEVILDFEAQFLNEHKND